MDQEVEEPPQATLEQTLQQITQALQTMEVQLVAYRAEHVAVVQAVHIIQQRLEPEPGNPPVPPLNPAGPVAPSPPPRTLPESLPAAMSPLPKRFSGDPREYAAFITHCKLHFRHRPLAFQSDRQKVSFLLMLLEGSAIQWARPFIDREDPILDNYNVFLKAFANVFEKKFMASTRKNEFLALRQGNMELVPFISQFQAFAAETGWAEDTQVAMFHRALRDELKDSLINVYPLPDSMHEMVNLVLRLDHRLTERRGDKRRAEYRPLRLTPAYTPTPKVDIDAPEPMILGEVREPLSEKERTRRRVNRLCFYCGKPDHHIRVCPVRPSKEGNDPAH